MNFCEVSQNNFDTWLAMGLALWPHYDECALRPIFINILKNEKETAYLYQNDAGVPIAFINLSLRTDHVQGSTTSPVGYVEAIYVKPDYRKQGIAKELIAIAEKWASEKGCTELGSDTEIDNLPSQQFHKNLGFKEANRTVNFIKNIEQ